MGLILQRQRMAVESFAGHPQAFAPPSIDDVMRITDSRGQPLYPAGISRGYGTCATIKNMNVLVLTDRPAVGRLQAAGELACAYTVLTRRPTEQELATDYLAQQGIARSCVELVVPLEQRPDALVFQRTELTELYTAI